MNIIKNVSMTTDSPILTLSKTSDLSIGLFLYGDGITIDSQILSIDSDTQITLTKNATKTQSVNVEFTTASRDIYLDRLNALDDVSDIINERGDLIHFIFRTESDVTRDGYNSINKRDQNTVLAFRAFPVEFQPSEKRLEKAGIKENVDVLIYTSMKDWLNYGIDFNDIEMATRNTVKLQGNIYEIRAKGLMSQFNDTYLYVTFGLNKK